MREIKFRGKSISSKEWVKGNYCVDEEFYDNGGIGCNYREGMQEIHYIINGKIVDIVYPESVGQYTGLKDKNGIEIYEGDIIKAEHDNFHDGEEENRPEYKPWIGEIVFLDGHYSIETKEEYSPAIFNIRIKSIEIVGNIYDNKELMEYR